MDYKRVTLLSGHYGSGKTNIAVNIALELKKHRDNVAIADLDIVNPYFRTKDSQAELENAGIRFICSEYANTNLDIPALPQQMYSITDDQTLTAVMDIGGDDRGALALGRYTPALIEENNYDMLLVVNRFRPLTPDAESTVEIMREIEAAGGLPFTGIINNSNLGDETTPEDVLSSVEYAEKISSLTGLPVKMTTVRAEIYNQLTDKVPDLFPLTLQPKIR
jgi:hypothetical protein